MVAGGYSVERILKAYTDLAHDDVNAALEYAAKMVALRGMLPTYGMGCNGFWQR